MMYRIVCEIGSALRCTLPPRLYLDGDVKVEESSSKFVTERKAKRHERRTNKRLRDHGASLCCEQELLGAAA